MKNNNFFYLKIFHFLLVKFSAYLNRHVFVIVQHVIAIVKTGPSLVLGWAVWSKYLLFSWYIFVHLVAFVCVRARASVRSNSVFHQTTFEYRSFIVVVVFFVFCFLCFFYVITKTFICCLFPRATFIDFIYFNCHCLLFEGQIKHFLKRTIKISVLKFRLLISPKEGWDGWSNNIVNEYSNRRN